MESIQHFGNDKKWHDLYDYKMNRGDNLSGLDIDKAIANLKLDDRYIQKEVALYGKDPRSISTTMIKEVPSARFVSDNQIKYWNSKTNAPLTGYANFPGNSKTIKIAHGAVDRFGVAVRPYFCTYTLLENTLGRLGEVWCTWDATESIFGNTGSYTGKFMWAAFYTAL